jgi:Tol biopolymer transport system component
VGVSALVAMATVGGAELGTPGIQAGAEVFSPTFAVSGEPDRGGIHLLGNDGTGRRRLRTRVPASKDDSSLANWSPDGQRLVFSSGDGNEPFFREAIRVINVDGSGERRLTARRDFSLAPSFSPDGQNIAFSRFRIRKGKLTAGLVAMRADGTGQRQLTRSPDYFPVWSPDGRKIAFTRLRPNKDDAEYAVYVMSVNGRDVTRLVDDAQSPSWSPDGRRIAVATDRDHHGRICHDDTCRPSSEIYVINADGSGQKRLTRNRADDQAPVWSPDGRQVALASNRSFRTSEGYETYVVDDDSGCVQRVTNGTPPSEFVAWRPGSSAIPRTECGGTLIGAREPAVETDTSEAQQFSAFPLFYLGPVYRGMLLTDAPTKDEIDEDDSAPLTFDYGDCRLLVLETCGKEFDVTVHLICSRDPLLGDDDEVSPASFRRPRYSVERGALVARYGRRDADIYTDSSAVQIDGSPSEIAQMIAALRPLGGLAGEALKPPAFSRSLLAELRQIRRVFSRYGSSMSAARRLHVTRKHVLQALRLERALRRFGRLRSTAC